MGLGLLLNGEIQKHRFKEPPSDDRWLKAVAKWAAKEFTGFGRWAAEVEGRDGGPLVRVCLHPAAEEVEISIGDPGWVNLSSKTSTAGPGFHVAVCELADDLAKRFGIAWRVDEEDEDYGDETGYFETRDLGRLNAEMLTWLGAVAPRLLEMGDDGASGLMLSMPIGNVFHVEGFLVTPVGPRSREWVQRVVRDPAEGIDVFPWWAPGETPAMRLGRALYRMWCEVRWRDPLEKPEATLLAEILADLRAAWEGDPTLPLPLGEWRELAGYADSPDAYLGPEPAPFSVPPVGYWRNDVTASVNEWRVTQPGEFLQEIEENGTWLAYGADRNIRLTPMTITDQAGNSPPAQELADHFAEGEEHDPSLDTQDGPAIGRAGIVKDQTDDGRRFRMLQGAKAIDGEVVTVSIVFFNRADEAWAIETWRSIQYAGD